MNVGRPVGHPEPPQPQAAWVSWDQGLGLGLPLAGGQMALPGREPKPFLVPELD